MYYGNIVIPFNPADCFVLELVVRNLSYNPRIVREFFMQLEDKRKEIFTQESENYPPENAIFTTKSTNDKG